MEGLIPVLTMLLCFDSIRLYPFCAFSILCEKGFSTFRRTVFCRTNILISKQHIYFFKWLCDIYQIWLCDISTAWVLSNVLVAIICWCERHCDVLHGMHSPLVAFHLTFRRFCLCLILLISLIPLKTINTPSQKSVNDNCT